MCCCGDNSESRNSCSCSSNPESCKLHPSHANRSTRTFVLALEAVRPNNQAGETSVAAENSGCKCGSNCTCDPCNCK